MGIKYSVASVLNRLASMCGARIERSDAPAPWQYTALQDRHVSTVIELRGCLEHFAFPDLPSAEGRDALLGQLVGTNVSEAMWLLNCLHQSMTAPGDVCEFGIAEGATSALLANEIRSEDKKLWLFDSFQGLSKPGAKDELIDDIFGLGTMDAYAGKMSYPPSEAIGRVAATGLPSERLKIVPGFIENTIRTATLPAQVCFAYVDFDFYDPIATALSFLHSVLTPGGAVVVDDYDFFSSGAKTAVDEFADLHSEEYTLETPPAWAGHFAVMRRRAGCEASRVGAAVADGAVRE